MFVFSPSRIIISSAFVVMATGKRVKGHWLLNLAVGKKTHYYGGPSKL